MKFVIGIEVTSTLQATFAMSLIRKITSPADQLSIHVYFANKHINFKAQEAAKLLLKKFFKKIEFIDLKETVDISNKIKKIKYDILIVRSRMKYLSQDRFIFTREFFRSTGNCQVAKNLMMLANAKRLYSVDDGLSNWEEPHKSYLRQVINYRKVSVPSVLFPLIPESIGVRHFSIFSRIKKFCLHNEFYSIIKDLSNGIKKCPDVKFLYLGIWPQFPGDRIALGHRDFQVDYLNKFILEENIDKRGDIYVKPHPKYSFEIKEDCPVKFKLLDPELAALPAEVLFECLPNLEAVFGFPSTSLFLARQLIRRGVSVTVFKSAGDPTLFPQRASFISARISGVHLYEFDNSVR